MTKHPCPYESHCALADDNCTEELATTCDVIHNITPPAPKPWDPQELVSVTMTKEQWTGIMAWLIYGADWNNCRMVWWRDHCDDKKVGAARAKEYEEAMLRAESLRKIIAERLTAE